MPHILCAGLIAADLVFEVPAFPVKGAKTKAISSRMITGGGALNAASAIARLGGQASLAGAVGDDVFGAFLRDQMVRRGIGTDMLHEIAGVSTSRSANLITPDGDRTIVNHRPAALIPDSIDLPPGFGFDAALVDTRWPDGAARIVAAARAAGKPAIIDAEAPVAEAARAMRGASHVAFSEQGLADFVGGSDGAALAEAARRLGTWCAVTRGAAPVLCHDGRHLSQVATCPTMARNTLGAGDVWHGAFALALAQGQSEREAVGWANAAAALKVQRPLDDEGLPTGAEVQALLAI